MVELRRDKMVKGVRLLRSSLKILTIEHPGGIC